MSEEYKKCKKAIDVLLIQEKKLIRKLKDIQKTKIDIALILNGIEWEEVE